MAEGWNSAIAGIGLWGVRSELVAVYGMNVWRTNRCCPTLSCIVYPEGLDDAKFRFCPAKRELW